MTTDPIQDAVDKPKRTYQWFRLDGFAKIPIPGATEETYTTTKEDVGYGIAREVYEDGQAPTPKGPANEQA